MELAYMTGILPIKKYGEHSAVNIFDERYAVDPSAFQNDMTTFQTKDDVLTLLVHLGYLTYDRKDSEVFIPNQEIEQEFMRAVKTGGWEGLKSIQEIFCWLELIMIKRIRFINA